MNEQPPKRIWAWVEKSPAGRDCDELCWSPEKEQESTEYIRADVVDRIMERISGLVETPDGSAYARALRDVGRIFRAELNR